MAEFSIARSPKTSEVIARALVAHIIENGLEEGARLPPEREMAASFGVGRGTLREALRLLETRGVISMRMGPGGGPTVRYPRAEDLSEALTLILEFQGVALQDVVEARETLECLNVRQAAQNITDEQLAALEDSVRITHEQIDDLPTFLRETQRFHRVINDACGNLVMRVYNETLYAITHAAVTEVTQTPAHREAVAVAHGEVLSAIQCRDADAAVIAMRQHVKASGSYWHEVAGNPARRRIRWLTVDGSRGS